MSSFNQTIPFTPENIEATKALFGENLGEGAIVQPPLKGVCIDMVHIGKGTMIMPDCLMMSRGGITIEDGAMIAANVQLISNNHDLHDSQGLCYAFVTPLLNGHFGIKMDKLAENRPWHVYCYS